MVTRGVSQPPIVFFFFVRLLWYLAQSRDIYPCPVLRQNSDSLEVSRAASKSTGELAHVPH